MRRYVSRFDVEWAHCDAAGIVFHPHFYVWFDQGTGRLFQANGLSYTQLSERGILGLPLVETGARYENPCRLGEALELNSWIDDWANKTFLVRHRVTHADGRLALEGFERRVWAVTDPASPRGMRAEAIPADVIARFDE